VAAQWGRDRVAEAVAGAFPGGATLDEGGTGRAWVLIDDGETSSLGPALVWASRRGIPDLHVLVDDGAARSSDKPGASGATVVTAVDPAGDRPGIGADPLPSAVIARRAGEWAAPATVWRIEGSQLGPADPAGPSSPPPPPGEVMAFADVLRAHGADPVVEHGRLLGEVLGLEVARVVPRPGGGWGLEVGVGRLDRFARAEMRPDEPAGAAVEEAVGVVRTWRRPGMARHPANTLARERWLRSVVVAHPSLVGAAQLAPIPPPLPRRGLRQGAAAPAAGRDGDGRPMIVMCSTGVDVDVVPAAADARLLHAGDRRAEWRLVVVVPEGDDYPVTHTLASGLRSPAEVRTVGRDWSDLTAP
jgi:hypothetical protein